MKHRNLSIQRYLKKIRAPDKSIGDSRVFMESLKHPNQVVNKLDEEEQIMIRRANIDKKILPKPIYSS